MPKNVEEGDLIGFGSLDCWMQWRGLILDGVKFKHMPLQDTGSMITGSNGLVPVSVRHRNRWIEETIRDLENRLGRSLQMLK